MKDEKKKQSRLGPEYQADAPPWKKAKTATEGDHDKCVWRMPNGIDKDAVKRFYKAFISKPQAARRIAVDHALDILMNNEYDFERSMREAKSRRLPVEPWTVEDEKAFLRAFTMVEKNFAAIARMFPGTSTSEVVEHYYNSKRTVDYRSYRDPKLQNKEFKMRAPSINLDNIPLQDSYMHKMELDRFVCQNCGRANVPVYDVNEMLQCLPCRNFFRLTGQQRPCRKVDAKWLHAPCPKEMEEVAKKFVEMAETVQEGPASADDDVQVLSRHRRSHILLSTSRRKANAAKTAAQLSENKVKKECQSLKAGGDLIDKAKIMLANMKEHATRRTPSVTDSWSKNEETAAFHCLTTGGHSFKDVAAIVGSRTELQICAYYTQNRDAINEVLSAQNEKAVTFDREAVAVVESELVDMANNAPVEVIELE